jgi:hypothetical protein
MDHRGWGDRNIPCQAERLNGPTIEMHPVMIHVGIT